jgi:hypothetical protein
MGNRERFFECVFDQGGVEHRCLVHAWNESQAAEELRDVLRAQGAPEPAGLTVRRFGSVPAGEATREPDRF